MTSPPTIPDHTLLRPIGRGAYGEVWLARNVMGVLRAVKIVERKQFDSDRPYQREFAGIQRYEPVSRIADGLVHVLHVGRNDAAGHFYYVMELADGAVAEEQVGKGESEKVGSDARMAISPAHSLTFSPANYSPRTLRADLKRLHRLPIADCLRVALDVVSGLARLHEQGLVHRDVKPGNIIFVNGRAKLADIGLVSTYAEGRTFVGTEGYIPPEGPGSPVADIYALGMCLYEVATGYPPEEFPKVPTEWFSENTGTEAIEFHEIVLKACEGARERRYQSAEEMQADLALLQSGQSVRHLRALEKREKRWRQIGWVATISVAIAMTTALAANWRAKIAADSQAKETQLREQAQKSLARAMIAERDSRQQLYTSLLEQARATVRSGEMGHRVRALDAIRRAAAISNSVELRREVFAALALPDLKFEKELLHGSAFTVRQLDPTFQFIALARGRGPVEIHATLDDRIVATLPASTNRPAHNARWSRDGRFLAIKRDHDSMGSRADLEVWEWPSARRVLLVRNTRWNGWSFHPREPQLLATGDGWIATWDLRDGKELARRKTEATPEQLAYSPDGNRVAASYQSTNGWNISIHNAADSTLLASHVFANRISSFDWHPGGHWIVVSDFAGAVHRMDAQTGESQILGQHKAEAVMAAFSPDGAYLITGGWERELICWDVSGMRRAFTIGLDSYALQFRGDGSQCAVVTSTGVQLHAFERPVAHRALAEDLGPRLRYAKFSPDGHWLVASADQRAGVWNLSGHGPAALADEALEAHCSFTADGRELFGSRSRGDGGDCFRWRVIAATNEVAPPRLERLPLHKPEGFTFLAVRSNSVVLTGANGSQLLAPEDIETGSDRWAQTSPGVSGVSPDGRWLAIYRPFSTSLFVYRLPDLEEVARLTHPANIAHFKFSPLGDELAITSNRGVEFWSTRTWEQTRMLTNFSRILYSPDARAIWLHADQRTTGLYNARSAEPLLMLPSGMLLLALSPDGRRLAVSVDARRLQVWDLAALRAELVKLNLDW